MNAGPGRRPSSPRRAIESNVTQTGHGLHRDPDQGGGARRPGPDPDARAVPDPGAVGLGVRVARRVRRARRRRPPPAPPRRPPRPPRRRRRPARRRRVARGLAGCQRLAGRQPRVQPGRRDRAGGALPTQGKLGEIRVALEDAARHDRRAAVAVDGRRGRVQRPDHAGPDADPRRLDRDPALDHLPLPRLPDGRHGARRAAPRRASSWSASSRSWARSSASRSTACS